MSSQALAVVRAFCDAVVAGDSARITEMLDRDVVWFGTRGGLDQDLVVRGTEAFAEYSDEIAEPWERLNFDVDQLIDAGAAIVVFWRETARPRHADLEVGRDTAAVIRVRQGKIAEVRGYLDREEALEAARGLEHRG